MKKLSLLTVIILSMLLSACTGSGTYTTDSQVIVDESKTTITLASYGVDPFLQSLISSFNNSNNEYSVRIIDISQGNTLDGKSALTKFNTEIISGNSPDMICLQYINPFAFITKGLLYNQNELFTNDTDINLSDLAILNALKNNEAIYYVGSGFTFETLIARHSQFGSRYGWSLKEYLEIESSIGKDSNMIYNMTQDAFLREISSRYIRTAIDWENGSCNFNTKDFFEILEASKRIKENPETSSTALYSPGAVNVSNGTLVASLSWVTSVDKLSSDEKLAGCKLSYIGWPTPDGSCGTDAYLINPIGIFASSQHIEGCWEFIKFVLKNHNIEYGMPLYMPHLEKKLEEAKTREEENLRISPNDVDTFLSLISSIENIAIYDETVLDIITKESSSFFSGDKSAQEVVNLIQSKVSIYISEQK